MAINWSAYEAAKELYGDNKTNIKDIGSRFPLFSRTVMAINDEYLLDLLKAIPKVSAGIIEKGMKEEVSEEPEEKKEEAKEVKETKSSKKTKSKVEPEEDAEEEEEDLESMTTKELYKLCCERGISGKVKDRKKETLINALKGVTEKAKEAAEEEEDWNDEDGDDWEEEKEKDPYAGKKAVELYKMCKERGIKAKQKLSAEEYAKLLKKDDAEKEKAESDEDDDDDDWEI